MQAHDLHLLDHLFLEDPIHLPVRVTVQDPVFQSDNLRDLVHQATMDSIVDVIWT